LRLAHANWYINGVGDAVMLGSGILVLLWCCGAR